MKFAICYNHSFLPINVGVPSLSTSNNCEKLIVINTIFYSLLVNVLLRKTWVYKHICVSI